MMGRLTVLRGMAHILARLVVRPGTGISSPRAATSEATRSETTPLWN